MPILYIAINKMNGKRYVGVTRRTIVYRRYMHIWSALHGKKDTVFAKAIRKYEGRTKDGFRFMYADQNEPPIMKYVSDERRVEARKEVLAALARGQKKIKKKIRCVDDDRVFDSITEASKEYGQHISSISAAIYRKGKSGGLTFEFSRAS